MKAIIKNESGLKLYIPKTGFAPMLFLEIMAESKAPTIEKIINPVQSEYFEIRLLGTLSEYQRIRDYINDNL